MTADWILIPSLVQLRAEFNAIAPGRSHVSDGSIGDAAHQAETSDHNPDETGAVPIHDADHLNEVHAIDVTTDLGEASGLTMERVVQFLLTRCRSGAETRLRYAIFNRRIWEADNDWRQKAYTLADPHTGHAHFSASYTTSKEASTASWHLGDIPVALTADDKDDIKAIVAAAIKANNDDMWNVQGDVNVGDIQGTGKPSMQTMLNVTRYGSYERNKILARLAEVSAAQVRLEGMLAAISVPPPVPTTPGISAKS
jgi:hypothetical protein